MHIGTNKDIHVACVITMGYYDNRCNSDVGAVMEMVMRTTEMMMMRMKKVAMGKIIYNECMKEHEESSKFQDLLSASLNVSEIEFLHTHNKTKNNYYYNYINNNYYKNHKKISLQ